jgi:CubicO group peptidase (beta-lactamase class C family)
LIGYAGYGHGLGGVVLVDAAASGLPGSPGIYRWWGLVGTFVWIDPTAELIGMVWTQFNNGVERLPSLEQEFQRLTYAALR